MLKGIGLTELIIIVLILILLFGGKKIKTLAKQTGEAAKELKKIKKEYEGKATVTTPAPKPKRKKNINIEKEKGGVNNVQ